jgi:hypothetical protein
MAPSPTASWCFPTWRLGPASCMYGALRDGAMHLGLTGVTPTQSTTTPGSSATPAICLGRVSRRRRQASPRPHRRRCRRSSATVHRRHLRGIPPPVEWCSPLHLCTTPPPPSWRSGEPPSQPLLSYWTRCSPCLGMVISVHLFIL